MAKVRLYGDTSGYVDLKAPDVAGDVTITLPNTTGPFATETYVDSAVAAIPSIAGIGSNVVQTVKTDTFSTTSTSLVDVTGVTATITPTSASSKVLVAVHGVMARGTDERIDLRLARDATDIASAAGGTSANTVIVYVSGGNWSENFSIFYLDSPATTSAITYKLRMSVPAGTGYIGRISTDRRSITTITAIEVAT